MRVLVTGACGYIGRHVVEKLCNAGADVTAIDYYSKGDIDSRAKMLEYNIFEMSDAFFQNLGDFDVCLHLAWKNSFNHNSNTHILELSSHYAFLHSLVKAGIKRIAVIGTVHEIGCFEGEVDEDTPCNPLTLYGIAKNTLRKSLEVLSMKEAFTLQWLRAYYIFGDDARNSSVFTKISDAAAKGIKTFPFVSGTNQCDFIDIESLAEQITAVVMQDKINGIINCCSGVPIAMKDKAEQFILEKNYDLRLEYGKYPERVDASPAIWGNPDKIRTIMKNRQK